MLFYENHMDIYISAIETALGESTDIISLIDENHPENEIENLILGGLRHFLKSNKSPVDLAVECVQKQKITYDLDLNKIDNLIYSTSAMWKYNYIDRFAISRLVGLVGKDISPICLYGNGCANVYSAIDIAYSLIASGKNSTVLVITSDVAGGQKSRIISPGLSIASDGASSFIVSTEKYSHQAFKIKQIETIYSSELGSLQADEARGEFFAKTANAIRLLGKKLSLRQGCIVDSLITNNYKKDVVEMFSLLLGVENNLIDCSGIERYGHCFSSDTIIGLKHVELDKKHILTLASGTQNWAACLLEGN